MTFENRYSKTDRLLHRMAFSGINIQKALADMEDRIYSERFSGIEIDRPVFITSLPRAGTTLFLELISSLDSFATHTYREMPFLLIPLLWNSISRPFRTSEALRERAHGDGMSIGYDSVEAFEEILWHAFWPEKYAPSEIIPWKADDSDAHDEFIPFFKNHIRKLIALRSSKAGQSKRYVSKNNANLSRTQKIERIFPKAIILVPFRNPLDHVASMMRQHDNFRKIHSEDPFAKGYMKDIGHFDFGDNFRPINFSGWLDGEEIDRTGDADFWVKYWSAAFEHLLSNPSKNLFFISYENCCENPVEALRTLGSAIGLADPEILTSQADRFRRPTAYNGDGSGVDTSLLKRAMSLHADLLRASII